MSRWAGAWPPDWPPWEWAGGDPIACNRVAAGFGAFYGAVTVVLVLWALALLGAISTHWPSVSGLVPTVLTWAPVLGFFAVLAVIPRRTAIVAALGFSPLGIRLRMPFPYGAKGNRVCPWSLVRQVGPDWIVLDGLGFASEKYRLTPYQADRLHAFLSGTSRRARPA